MTDDLPRPFNEQWVVVGTGFVGSALAAALKSRSVTHRIVHAPRVRHEMYATTAQTMAAVATAVNQCEIEKLAEAFVGASVVVNAAGLATPGAPASTSLSGANGLLPGLIFAAAIRAGVRCMIHLSSVAVQGRARLLTESERKRPQSAYGRSKALGEDTALQLSRADPNLRTQLRILRATSVQGPRRSHLGCTDPHSKVADGERRGHRGPTQSCIKFAGANLGNSRACRGSPMRRRSSCSLGKGLQLASSALQQFGATNLLKLPTPFCRMALWAGYAISRGLRGRFDADLRRLEIMWFGQRQVPGWLVTSGTLRRPQPVRSDGLTVLFGATAALTARVFMLEQCRYLARQGWAVHLVTADGAERTPAPEFVWHTIEMQRTISPFVDIRSIRQWIRLIRTPPSPSRNGRHAQGRAAWDGRGACLPSSGSGVPRPRLARRGLTGRTRAVSLLAERLTCRLATHIRLRRRGPEDPAH